jgi:hypothetical protein
MALSGHARRVGRCPLIGDTRRVTRTEYDGTITVLIDKFDGSGWSAMDGLVFGRDTQDATTCSGR